MFDVREEKIETVDGISVRGKKAIVNCETNKVISIVSDNYKLVKNADLIESFEEYLSGTDVKFIKTREQFSGKNDQKWSAKYRFPEIKANLGTIEGINGTIQDDIELMLELQNSYDGSTKWGFSVMGYRLVCLNGLRVSEALYRIKEMHVTDEEETSDIINLGFQTARSIFENKMASSWEEMKKLEFNSAMVVTLLIALEHNKKYTEIFNEMYAERMKNRKLKTAWDFYNMVTWFTTHVVDRKNKSLASKIATLGNRIALDN